MTIIARYADASETICSVTLGPGDCLASEYVPAAFTADSHVNDDGVWVNEPKSYPAGEPKTICVPCSADNPVWAALLALVEAGTVVLPRWSAPPPDMPALRQAAFATAMEYGNGITAKVTGTYSDVEARTWPLQRAQADTVLHGGELPEDALLRKLAARRGMALEAFALAVQHKAQAFETIADVGQGLRLGAEGLLSPDLDTPEALAAAVEDLRAQTLAAAAALGLSV